MAATAIATARPLFLVAVVTAAMAAMLAGVAHGASYTAGAPAGSWGLQTNYTRWASAITFRAGDELVFKYSRGAHDVEEVSKAGYDSCSASSPLASFATGDDTVLLPAAGVTRYFICGVPGHCAVGMKLAVSVQAVAAMAPRDAASPPMAPTLPAGAGAPPAAAGGMPAVPPPSSAAASSPSLARLGFAAAVAALVALYIR